MANELPEGFQLDSGLPAGFELDQSQSTPKKSFVDKADEALRSIPGSAPVWEAGAAINRGMTNLADFFTTDQVNAIMEIVGSEKRVPRITEALSPATTGNYMEPGLARDIIQSGGELAGPGAATGAALKGVRAALPQATAMAPETVGQNVIRQLSSSTPLQEAGFGALSGAGGEAGEAIDKSLGGSGEIGGAVGAISAPLAPAIRVIPGRAKAAAEALDPPRPEGVNNMPPGERVPVEDIDIGDAPLPRRAKIRRAIQQGDKEGALHRITPEGQVVRDRVAREAHNQGFDTKAIATIKSSSPADRRNMEQMLDRAEASLRNATEGARNRPSDVIGNSVMRRWEAVMSANRQAGRDIRNAIDNVRTETVDMEDVADNFADSLDNLGIGYEMTRNGLRLDFKGSQIEGNSAVAPIKRVYDRLRSSDSAGNLQRLKQYIDSQINWNRSPDKPLDTQAVAVLKELREGINQKLRAISDDYANANDRFRETREATNAVMDVMGRRFDPEGEGANALVGQEMRKVLSNYAKRDPMTRAIDQLDAVAANHGARFDDDPIHQVVFYNDLERVFGSFAPNSLQGVTEKAAERGARSIMKGNIREGVIDAAVDAGFNRLRGRSEQNAIRAMRNLLREQ